MLTEVGLACQVPKVMNGIVKTNLHDILDKRNYGHIFFLYWNNGCYLTKVNILPVNNKKPMSVIGTKIWEFCPQGEHTKAIIQGIHGSISR